jgi:hypothetical protein
MITNVKRGIVMAAKPYALLALSTLLAAGAAVAEPLKPTGVFANAAPVSKALMIALALSSVAALVVGVFKLMRGPQLNGGSAFLSSLRFGGPLIGLLGAAWVGLSMFLGLANSPVTPDLKGLAPGLAEAALLLGLGFLSGVVAVTMNWTLEARIDRAILRP